MEKEEKKSIKISKKEKKALCIIITCAVIALLCVFVIKPYMDRNRATQWVADIANEYGIDLKCIKLEIRHYPEEYRFLSEGFSGLSTDEQMSVIDKVKHKLDDNLNYFFWANGDSVKIVSGGIVYWISKGSDNREKYDTDYGKFNYLDTYNSEFLFAVNEQAMTRNAIAVNKSISEQRETTTNTSPKARKKCETCNGAGYIRYNYGSSDLEALLDGEAPYTVSECYTCHGTGYVDD